LNKVTDKANKNTNESENGTRRTTPSKLEVKLEAQTGNTKELNSTDR
jgi:hypothetical protein